jgi:hypothetical protein
MREAKGLRDWPDPYRSQRRKKAAQGGCRWIPAWPLVVLVAAVVLVFSSAVAEGMPARSGAGSADVDVSIALSPGTPSPVVGVPFAIIFGFGNGGPDATSARPLIDLPEGLRAVSENRLGCPTGTGTLDCGVRDLPAGDENDGVSGLVATQPGHYTIVARVTDLTATDPNPANNTASVTIDVGSAPLQLAVSGFAVSPAKPRAGAPLKASFAVINRVTGARVAPSAVRCAAVVGRVTARARGSVVKGRAICTFFPPRSAKGKIVRGKITATAERKRVTKAFAVRLG